MFFYTTKNRGWVIELSAGALDMLVSGPGIHPWYFKLKKEGWLMTNSRTSSVEGSQSWNLAISTWKHQSLRKGKYISSYECVLVYGPSNKDSCWAKLSVPNSSTARSSYCMEAKCCSTAIQSSPFSYLPLHHPFGLRSFCLHEINAQIGRQEENHCSFLLSL